MPIAGSAAVLPERIVAKIEFSGECWLWRGCRDARGYGHLWMHGKKLAHRVVYELVRGPITHELHHVCETPSCVNPAHLEDLAHRPHANLHRSEVCPHGHRYEGENVRVRAHPDGRVQRVCVTCNREAGRRFREKEKT